MLSTAPGRRGMRPWSCHGCYYCAPKALISWYLLSSSAASRLPGKRERAVSRLGLQPKQWLSQGLGRESEGLAFTAWKGPALTRLVHTRCCVVWGALLLSSTCRPRGSHVLGVLQTTPRCWEFKKKKKHLGARGLEKEVFSLHSILHSWSSHKKTDCWPSSSTFKSFLHKLQPTL